MSTVLSSAHSLSSRLKAGAKDSWALVRSPDSLCLGLNKNPDERLSDVQEIRARLQAIPD